MKHLNQLLALALFSATAFGMNAQDTVVPAPPVPTQSADDVLSITGYYGDAGNLKMAQYSDKGWAQLTVEDKTVWEMPTFDYAKLQFDEIDLSQYTTLHLDIYAVDAMTGAMKYTLANGAGPNNLTQSKVKQLGLGEDATGKWTSYDWNIEDTFTNTNGFDLSTVTFLVLGDTKREKSKTFYIGNVYAYGKKIVIPTLGDFVANVDGKNYTYNGDGETATEIEAFIGEELPVSISIANAETLSAAFTPETIAYTNENGVVSFTATENCTVTLTATLGEETKTAVYSFSFVEAPEINYPVYIGTRGYESLAAAMSTISNDNPKVEITLAESIESATINVGGGSLTEYINLTIKGKTGNESIKFTTGNATQPIKVNKGIINLKDLVLESNGQNFTCAVAFFPYASSFNFENVTFMDFTTNQSIIEFSPNTSSTGTLSNVKFENCIVNNEETDNAQVYVGKNGNLKLGDGNDELTIFWTATSPKIEYVGNGVKWLKPAKIVFSAILKIQNGVSGQAVLLNCSHPENFKISGAVKSRFYSLFAKEGTTDLYLRENELEENQKITTEGNKDFSGESYGSYTWFDATALTEECEIQVANPNALVFASEGIGITSNGNVVIDKNDKYSATSFHIADGYPFNYDYDIACEDVSFTRTGITDSEKYVTAILPFDVMPSNGVYEYIDCDRKNIYFDSPAQGTTIPAYTPLVIKAENLNEITKETEKLKELTLNGCNVAALSPNGVTNLTDASKSDNGMKYGFLTSRQTIELTNDEVADYDVYGYSIKSYKFVKATGSFTISPFRVFFLLPKREAAQSNAHKAAATSTLNIVIDGRSIDGEDISTGIEETLTAAEDNEVIYNLMGQPVKSTYRGIAIRGGKKVIMK